MDDTGYHYILDLKLKSSAILSSGATLRALIERTLGDFTVLKYDEYQFTEGGGGVTGFFLLSESHCSFHTYPENNYIALDIFTCGNDPKGAVSEIIDQLDCAEQNVRFVKRGSGAIESHGRSMPAETHNLRLQEDNDQFAEICHSP